MPSTSARVLAAVRVWPWVGVPLMVTAPVGASLTAATVRVMSWVSTLPSSSVTETVKLSVPCQLAVGA